MPRYKGFPSIKADTPQRKCCCGHVCSAVVSLLFVAVFIRSLRRR